MIPESINMNYNTMFSLHTLTLRGQTRFCILKFFVLTAGVGRNNAVNNEGEDEAKRSQIYWNCWHLFVLNVFMMETQETLLVRWWVSPGDKSKDLLLLLKRIGSFDHEVKAGICNKCFKTTR